MNRKTLKRLEKLNAVCYRQTELCSAIANIFAEHFFQCGSMSELDSSVLSTFLSKKLKSLKKVIAKIDQIIYEERE